MADNRLSTFLPNRSVMGAKMLQRPAESYLRQQAPEVYGGLGGLMGMAPDEMGGSVLDPNTARVRQGAQIGFPVGTALQVAPLAPMLATGAKATARALGPTAVRMGEGYLQRQWLMPGVVEGGAIPGRDVVTPQSKKELKSLADLFAEQIRALGFDAKVEHSGSKAGASSYINVSDPKTGRFLAKPIRISDHSKGPFESQNVINILNPEDDFPKVFEELNKMRAMGESLVFKQQKYAQSLIDDGVKPKVAYQRAKDEVKETPTSTLYPAEERMAIAQRNAALPVEQGGLGLPANNTATDRAAAQYGKDMVHFSRAGGDYTTLDSGKFAIAPFDAVGTHVGTPGAAMERYQNTVGYKVNNPNYANDELKGVTYPVTILGDRPMMNQNGMPFGEDDLNAFLRQQGGHNWSDIQGGKMTYQDMNADLRKKLFEEQGYTSIPYYNEVEGKGSISYIVPPENIRSRFAAFDPFRRNAAIAAAMGAAAPDLMAAQPKQQPSQNSLNSFIR